MNLRILKKLSKRAAPLLLALDGVQFGKVEHFKADREGSTGTVGHDRKHWLRNNAVHADGMPGTIVYQPRRRHHRYPFIHMREPWSAWAGTPMVGWTSGYETPEWEERTAWEHLTEIAYCSVTEYAPDLSDEDGLSLVAVTCQRLANPAQILRHAAGLVAAKAASA